MTPSGTAMRASYSMLRTIMTYIMNGAIPGTTGQGYALDHSRKQSERPNFGFRV